MIAVDKGYLKIVTDILTKYLPTHIVWAFGSRVCENPKKYSDLDIVIKTKAPLPVEIMAHLRDAFSESDLPFKVDVVDWSRISKKFQKIIKEKYEVIQHPS
ncbi:MAG: nucleotidyltransferase domain-containing protein [Deltaproteobacteria bacterium]|nr:nucleotidyltransferase domain-containing protein [Deltaproteobacteria bacterium]